MELVGLDHLWLGQKKTPNRPDWRLGSSLILGCRVEHEPARAAAYDKIG